VVTELVNVSLFNKEIEFFQCRLSQNLCALSATTSENSVLKKLSEAKQSATNWNNHLEFSSNILLRKSNAY
jgi:hypothetical protein